MVATFTRGSPAAGHLCLGGGAGCLQRASPCPVYTHTEYITASELLSPFLLLAASEVGKKRVQEDPAEGGVHLVKVRVGQPAPRDHDVDAIPRLEVHDEVEGARAPTGVRGPLRPVVLQELSPVAGRVQLGHAGIGHRQDGLHVRVPLGREGGRDQVAPVVRSREDPCGEDGGPECGVPIMACAPSRHSAWVTADSSSPPHQRQAHCRGMSCGDTAGAQTPCWRKWPPPRALGRRPRSSTCPATARSLSS